MKQDRPTTVAILLHLLLIGVGMLVPGFAENPVRIVDRPLFIIVGQQFRIIVRAPEETGELAAVASENLKLFDRWPYKKGDVHQRFYLEALRPGEASLKLSRGNFLLDISLPVLSWKQVLRPQRCEPFDVPRIWPMDNSHEEQKQKRTWFTDEAIAALRKGGTLPSPPKDWESLYNGMMPSNTPRVVFVNPKAGCPYCGTRIYENRSPFYPWLIQPEKHPYKVGCPECGRWFPSNDYAKGDRHSGDVADDGYGADYKGQRFPFIAYYAEWSYHGHYNVLPLKFAEQYARSGEHGYAQAAAIVLFRIAEQYLNLAINLNQRKQITRSTLSTVPMGILPREKFRIYNTWLYIEHNWEVPFISKLGRAYDLIFDSLQQKDDELLEFVQHHYHPEIQTMQDFRRFIETGYFRVMAQAILDKNIIGNLPQHQRGMMEVALTLGTARSSELIDWTMNGGGEIRFFLTNHYFKDGSAYESQGYNAGHVTNFEEIARIFELLRQTQPDAFARARFPILTEDPKYRQIFDFPIDFSLIGRTHAQTGDCGDVAGTSPFPLRQTSDVNPRWFLGPYRVTRDPKFAQAFYGSKGRYLNSVDDAKLRAEIKAVIKREGSNIPLESNFTDGYGHAILRSGKRDSSRALWLRYGRTRGHRHDDLLTIGFEALRRKLLPEIGYPHSWTYRSVWEGHWGAHYCGRVIGYSGGPYRKGALETFVTSPEVQVAAAVAPAWRGDPHERKIFLNRPEIFERSIMLIDLSPEDSYAVDLFRMEGGREHYWSFHGPRGEASRIGLKLVPQEGGTLAGRAIPYGQHEEAQKKDKQLAFLAYLTDVERAQPSQPWRLDWELEDQAGVHLRMTMVYPERPRVGLARGKPPGGGKPYNLQWAVVTTEGEDGYASQFIDVIEPYEGARKIDAIERVPLKYEGTVRFPPLALQVRSGDRIDTIILSYDADMVCRTPGGIESSGEFGFWSEDSKGFRAAFVARGNFIRRGDREIAAGPASIRGKIAEVDYPARKLLIRPAFPDPAKTKGKHLRITNTVGNDTSFKIISATNVPEGTEVTVDVDARIGEGRVRDWADWTIVGGTKLPLAGLRYYHGKTLSNEDGSALYRISGVVSLKHVWINPDEHPEAVAKHLRDQFQDIDGDGNNRYLIYDYGPGDDCTVANSVWVARE